MDSIPVSFFPSTPTGNLKLSGLFIELSNKSSKVKFEFPDAEASGFYDQVTYLNSKPLIELSILVVYLAEYLFAGYLEILQKYKTCQHPPVNRIMTWISGALVPIIRCGSLNI